MTGKQHTHPKINPRPWKVLKHVLKATLATQVSAPTGFQLTSSPRPHETVAPPICGALLGTGHPITDCLKYQKTPSAVPARPVCCPSWTNWAAPSATVSKHPPEELMEAET